MEKSILTHKWLTIKSMYEQGTNGSSEYGTNFEVDGELDNLSYEFIDALGVITQNLGFDCEVDGIKMDLWKERIWNLLENAGLLEDIAWKSEDNNEEIKDDWYMYDNEFDYEIKEPSWAK